MSPHDGPPLELLTLDVAVELVALAKLLSDEDPPAPLELLDAEALADVPDAALLDSVVSAEELDALALLELVPLLLLATGVELLEASALAELLIADADEDPADPELLTTDADEEPAEPELLTTDADEEPAAVEPLIADADDELPAVDSVESAVATLSSGPPSVVEHAKAVNSAVRRRPRREVLLRTTGCSFSPSPGIRVASLVLPCVCASRAVKMGFPPVASGCALS